MLSLLPSVLVLGLAALAAASLAVRRRSAPEDAGGRQAAARALALAVGIQSVHFVEEAANGFHERLGAVFGLPGMPFPLFIIFNVLWLGIWVVSIPALRSSRTWAFFASWFLALAGMVNGIAHPLLSIAVGGYFPGLVSAPLIGLASVWLWSRLLRATTPAGARVGR